MNDFEAREQRLGNPTTLESLGLAGGATLMIGGVLAAGFEETPRDKVERLIENNAILRQQIKDARAGIKSNTKEVKAIKGQNPDLTPPGIPTSSFIISGGGMLCAAVGLAAWGYRASKGRRWERKALKRARQNP